MSKLFKKIFCFDKNIVVIEPKDNNKKQIQTKDIDKKQIQTKDVDEKQIQTKDSDKSKNTIIPNLEEDPFFFT